MALIKTGRYGKQYNLLESGIRSLELSIKKEYDGEECKIDREDADEERKKICKQLQKARLILKLKHQKLEENDSERALIELKLWTSELKHLQVVQK